MHWFDRVLFAAIAVVTFFVAGLYFDAQEIFYFPREPFDFRDGPQQIFKYIADVCVIAAPFQKRALTAALLLLWCGRWLCFSFWERRLQQDFLRVSVHLKTPENKRKALPLYI